ncbi:MAG: hypothetical protein DRR15_18800 [Gammaproteobacteria bacterium]|nr:MAG: hypothetical protein DRR15_18800 [Gammaproteobacteria bacterium]
MRQFLLCGVLFAPYAVHAQSVPGRVELTPYGAYSLGGTFNELESDAAVELQDSGNFGLLLNVRQAANTQWEILYSQQRTDAEVTGLVTGDEILDTTVHYLQGGGTYQGDGEIVRPYLAATIGVAHFDVTTEGYDSDTYFSFSIGPGLQIWPNSRLGLRFEARAFGSLVRSDSSLFCLSDPANGTAGCAFTVSGDVLWQFQAMAGVVFRF